MPRTIAPSRVLRCHAAAMIDLHCHCLPGLDDGAPDVDESLRMLAVLAEAGYQTIAASPHFGEGPGGDASVSDARLARESLQSQAQGYGITLVPNAEHHLSPVLFDRLRDGNCVPVGGQGKWLLVELPWSPIPEVEHQVFRVQALGFKVLLAHPERYSYVDVATCERLVDKGVRLQCELGSFADVYGRRARTTVRELGRRGWVHVLASDLHRASQGSAILKNGTKEARRHLGDARVDAAIHQHPQKILENADANAIG